MAGCLYASVLSHRAHTRTHAHAPAPLTGVPAAGGRGGDARAGGRHGGAELHDRLRGEPGAGRRVKRDNGCTNGMCVCVCRHVSLCFLACMCAEGKRRPTSLPRLHTLLPPLHSYEKTRKERFMGWYHSHPFSVEVSEAQTRGRRRVQVHRRHACRHRHPHPSDRAPTQPTPHVHLRQVHSNCFLSGTDVQTQLAWQRYTDAKDCPWLAVVVCPYLHARMCVCVCMCVCMCICMYTCL